MEYHKFESLVLMVKGFSDNEVKNYAEIKESKKEKKRLSSFSQREEIYLHFARQKTNQYFWINSIRLEYDFNIASYPLFK